MFCSKKPWFMAFLSRIQQRFDKILGKFANEGRPQVVHPWIYHNNKYPHQVLRHFHNSKTSPEKKTKNFEEVFCLRFAYLDREKQPRSYRSSSQFVCPSSTLFSFFFGVSIFLRTITVLFNRTWKKEKVIFGRKRPSGRL